MVSKSQALDPESQALDLESQALDPENQALDPESLAQKVLQRPNFIYLHMCKT